MFLVEKNVTGWIYFLTPNRQYSNAVTRTPWGPRGLDAWYCGPAMYHYPCAHFCVPETGAMRVSGLYDLFLQHCIMPTFTHKDHVTAVNNELKEAILSLDKKAKNAC